MPEEKRDRIFKETIFISKYLKEHRELNKTQKVFLGLIDDVVLKHKNYNVSYLCDEQIPIKE